MMSEGVDHGRDVDRGAALTDAAAIQVFRRRGTIPPGHGDTIAAYLERQRDGDGDTV